MRIFLVMWIVRDDFTRGDKLFAEIKQSRFGPQDRIRDDFTRGDKLFAEFKQSRFGPQDRIRDDFTRGVKSKKPFRLCASEGPKSHPYDYNLYELNSAYFFNQSER